MERIAAERRSGQLAYYYEHIEDCRRRQKDYRRRVADMLKVYRATGKKISEQRKGWRASDTDRIGEKEARKGEQGRRSD